MKSRWTFLFLIGISVWIYSCDLGQKQVNYPNYTFEPILDTLDVSQLWDSAKHEFRHRPVRVFRTNQFLVFSNGSVGDFFVGDSVGRFISNYETVPKIKNGFSTVRSHLVSNPILSEHWLNYLRAPDSLIQINLVSGEFKKKSLGLSSEFSFDSFLLKSSNQLIFSEKRSITKGERIEKIVSLDLNSNQYLTLIENKGQSKLEFETSSGDGIYITLKNEPIILKIDLENGKFDTISIPRSKHLKYKEIDFKKEYLSLNAKEQSQFREDILIDMVVVNGYFLQLWAIFGDFGEDLTYKQLLLVSDGERIKEKIVEPNFLNFDKKGNSYQLVQSKGKSMLITHPVLELVDW